MRRHLANIYRLGVKELWSLARDPMLLILIVFSFTAMIYSSATSRHVALVAVAIANRISFTKTLISG